MGSEFPESDGTPAKTIPTKKIRMTMACERCRIKKVKCDFAHPSCARCRQTKSECTYGGTDTQVDLFNLVKLNETVDQLQHRIRSIESDMTSIQSNTQCIADGFRQGLGVEPPSNTQGRDNMDHKEHQPSHPSHGWCLSLSPRGLRIDTNVISIRGLYDILLTGMSNMDMNDTSDELSPLVGYTADDNVPMASTPTPLRNPRLKTITYSGSWDPPARTNKPGRLLTTSIGPSTLNLSRDTILTMLRIYCNCFLCPPCAHQDGTVLERYQKNKLHPMLLNAICAWTSHHGAVYHDLFPGSDPNQVGEVFFQQARSMLKDHFMLPHVDTIHSLLLMHIYLVRKSSPRDQNESPTASEAYIFLGIATRMGLGLKMYAESPSDNVLDKETNRRFFWILYLLETMSSMRVERPFSMPPDDLISVGEPTLLAQESTQDEVQWRTEFMIHRIRIARIYRDTVILMTKDQPRLSTVLTLDGQLQQWYDGLPSYFQYDPKRNWRSTSFRDQVCIKLNFEYHFHRCQLYGIFFSRNANDAMQNDTSALSRRVCVDSSRQIVDLFVSWCQLEQPWCLFSLDVLMTAALVFSYVLHDPVHVEEAKEAKAHLQHMYSLLVVSPVRHHKYVVALISRLVTLFSGTTHLDTEKSNDTTNASLASMATAAPANPTISSTATPATPATVHDFTLPPDWQDRVSQFSLASLGQQQMLSDPSSMVGTGTMAPMVLDVTTASSIFDVHKMALFGSFVADPMSTTLQSLYPPTGEFDKAVMDLPMTTTVASSSIASPLPSQQPPHYTSSSSNPTSNGITHRHLSAEQIPRPSSSTVVSSQGSYPPPPPPHFGYY